MPILSRVNVLGTLLQKELCQGFSENRERSHLAGGPSQSTTGQVQVSHRTENAGNLPKNYEHGPKPFVLNQSPAASECHHGQACLYLEVLDEYDHDPRTPDKLFDQASF